MAVNVGQRNVPDTPANRQLEAGEKAMDLALHTIKVCKNKKIFVEEYNVEGAEHESRKNHNPA